MMMMVGLLSVATAAGSSNKWPIRAPHADKVPASFDCEMRKAAYDYGRKLLPRLGSFESLYYALGLNGPGCTAPMRGADATSPSQPEPAPSGSIFVSPAGDDEGAGTEATPLQSIQLACDRAAASAARTVVLRGGTHFLSSTITLNASHSNLRVMAHPGEVPVVSGGVELEVAWRPHDVGRRNAANETTNIWVADVSGVDDIPGLQIDGVRATRARCPSLPAGISAHEPALLSLL